MISAVVDITEVRDRIMNLKLKEFIYEMNTACMPLDDVLDGMAEVRKAIYDLVSSRHITRAQ